MNTNWTKNETAGIEYLNYHYRLNIGDGVFSLTLIDIRRYKSYETGKDVDRSVLVTVIKCASLAREIKLVNASKDKVSEEIKILMGDMVMNLKEFFAGAFIDFDSLISKEIREF